MHYGDAVAGSTINSVYAGGGCDPTVARVVGRLSRVHAESGSLRGHGSIEPGQRVSETDASGKTLSRIDVTATAIHQGRTQQLWQAGITDGGRRLIATGQVRLQNVEPRT